MISYEYDGEQIEDIEKWAFDRSEKMVDYVERKRDPIRGEWVYRRGKMPESWWKVTQYSIGDFLPVSHKFRDPVIEELI